VKKLFGKLGKALVLTAAIGFAFSALTHPAAALNTGASITIQPVVDRPAITAGQTTDGEFKILNDGETDYTFDVYAKPYTVSGLKYDQNFENETNYTQISRWISFPQTSYELKSGASVIVKYQIKTPASIPDGSQYAAIFAQTRAVASAEKTGVTSSQRVGILIYARGNGKTIEKGEIVKQNLAYTEQTLNDDGEVVDQKVFAQKSAWYQSAPVAVSAQVKNTGNVDFDVVAFVEIKNFFNGRKITETVKSTASVLPGTTRQIDNIWCNSDADATGQAIYQCDAPSIGLFRVTQHVSFLGKEFTYERLVLILPWWIVALVIVAILLIISGFIYGKRRGRKNALKTHQKGDLKI
jgi:hypothetical protein